MQTQEICVQRSAGERTEDILFYFNLFIRCSPLFSPINVLVRQTEFLDYNFITLVPIYEATFFCLKFTNRRNMATVFAIISFDKKTFFTRLKKPRVVDRFFCGRTLGAFSRLNIFYRASPRNDIFCKFLISFWTGENIKKVCVSQFPKFQWQHPSLNTTLLLSFVCLSVCLFAHLLFLFCCSVNVFFTFYSLVSFGHKVGSFYWLHFLRI
jgi:hypothetical protein